MTLPEGVSGRPPEGGAPPPPDSIPWWRRLSLKLTVAIGVLIFGTILGMTLLGLRAQEQFLVSEAVRGAVLFSDTIRSSTHDQMLRGQKAEAYKVMASIGALERIEKVRLFNKEGRITYSTEEGEAGTFVDKKAESCYACHAAGKPIVRLPTANRARIYRSKQGHRILGMVTPIYNEASCSSGACHAHPTEQSVLGVVDIGISLAEIDGGIARLALRTAVVSAAAAVLLGLLAAYALRRFVLRPVREMVAATSSIGKGHLKEKVPVHSRDELGFLAKSINDMSVSLAESRQARLELLETLERQVEERTAALKSAQSQLVQTEKLASLGKLSASIAHEINNPLAGILTFAKLLIRSLETDALDESVRAFCVKNLKLIQRESERCTVIVRNLLDFARERPLKLEQVEAHAALEEALSLAAHKISIQGVELKKDLSPPAVVLADFGQIRQSFVNIILNACDAMPKGGILTLASRVFPEERKVEFAISDTGTGIAPEHLSKIFDPFFTTKEMGTGLGLSVVYGIIEKHGGTMTAESEVGRGTTMRIRLPLARPDGSAAPDASSGTGGR